MGNLCSSDRNPSEKPDNPRIEETINKYENLEVLGLIHQNINKIHLMKGDIVKKQFSGKDKQNFYNEVETYRVLSNLPFILKPFYINMKKGIIYLPYINSKPIKNAKNKKEVENYLFILRNQYGIWKDGEYIWNNLVQSSKTGQIYLIDFGNIPWFTTVSNTKWNIKRDLYSKTNLKEE
jgi:hypothetical protein